MFTKYLRDKNSTFGEQKLSRHSLNLFCSSAFQQLNRSVAIQRTFAKINFCFEIEMLC